MVTVGVVALVTVVTVLCRGVVGVVRVLCIGAVEQDCQRVVDILVLGGVFMVQVVEGVELEVGCFVRLVLWCANGRGYFLCHFSLKSVEMYRLILGGVSLWDGDLGGLFCPFGAWFLGQEGRCGRVDGRGG